jgi:hypothetical protein
VVFAVAGWWRSERTGGDSGMVGVSVRTAIRYDP